MTAEAAILPCCCGQTQCCPISAYTLALGSVSINFDFMHEGNRYFTYTGLIVSPTQNPISLVPALTQPIVLNKFNAPSGAIQCGFYAARNANTNTLAWTGGIARTYPWGQTVSVATGIHGQTPSNVCRYWVHPWELFGYPWRWEIGVAAGGIAIGLIGNGTTSGCPVTSFAPGIPASPDNRWRGCVRWPTTDQTGRPTDVSNSPPFFPFPAFSFPFSLT
jgi:hypothetical protein